MYEKDKNMQNYNLIIFDVMVREQDLHNVPYFAYAESCVYVGRMADS